MILTDFQLVHLLVDFNMHECCFQVTKAESVLLELKRLLDIDAKNDEIQKLSDEFFTNLAHNVLHQTPINTKHFISKKQELCQVGCIASAKRFGSRSLHIIVLTGPP